jgi:hypothetical protein
MVAEPAEQEKRNLFSGTRAYTKDFMNKLHPHPF